MCNNDQSGMNVAWKYIQARLYKMLTVLRKCIRVDVWIQFIQTILKTCDL